MISLYLNETIARRRFKDLLGNANQLLITILIGLSAVEQSLITESPPELRAAWNPKDRVTSAKRGRVMVLEMALVRATDALDTYISLSRRSPSLIQSKVVQSQIDGCRRSVLEKFFVMKNYCPSLGEVVAALTEVMIIWRNRFVHTLSEGEEERVSNDCWSILYQNSEWIRNEFRGMDVGRLFSDFEKDGPPTFKETASFIRNAHEVVRALDDFQLRSLNVEEYLRDLIWWALSKKASGDRDENRRRRAQSIWGRDASDKPSRVISFLKNNGLSTSKRADGDVAVFGQDLVNKVAGLKPKELFEFLSQRLTDEPDNRA